MVRTSRIDEITRFVANAVGICEGKGLDRTRRLLKSALSELEGLREKEKARRKVRNHEARQEGNFQADPRKAIFSINRMIEKEMEKTIDPDDGELMNG